LRHYGTEQNLEKWRRQTRHENLARSLSKTDKIRVAAEQQWKCARCEVVLPATFEVDHVEQWSLRKSDSRPLQALCANCHREKSYDDINIANCYFGNQSFDNLKCDEQKRHMLQSLSNDDKLLAEQEKQTKNVFSVYFND
jgi:hypothetical protein